MTVQDGNGRSPAARLSLAAFTLQDEGGPWIASGFALRSARRGRRPLTVGFAVRLSTNPGLGALARVGLGTEPSSPAERNRDQRG
jgi:hypothetical protein